MTPYDYQVDIANRAYEILKANYLVYLACEERTGKTLSAILTAEKCNSIKNILVITKKAALKGWIDILAAFEHSKVYTVVNYHKVKDITVKPDLVILDESHNYISGYPKPGTIHKQVKSIVYGCPIIYISATPYAQGPQMLFNQFALSHWSPWSRYGNFYRWFEQYGIPYTIKVQGLNRPQYDKVKTDLVLGTCEHLFVTKTRQELGFEHEPTDKLHYITLDETTRKMYNDLLVDNICDEPFIVCDTDSKLRTTLHQLEGGTTKDLGVLSNEEKLNYILANFGDKQDLVIMYNYKLEYDKLSARFSRARLLQATSYAEGVDLHKYSDLIIYSQDFSTARHTQRRARQCNQKRDTPIVIHHLLVKKAISEQVYKTVSVKKKNFVDSVFNKETI